MREVCLSAPRSPPKRGWVLIAVLVTSVFLHQGCAGNKSSGANTKRAASRTAALRATFVANRSASIKKVVDLTTCLNATGGMQYDCASRGRFFYGNQSVACPLGGCNDATCCLCTEGKYEISDGACVDVDECTVRTHSCDVATEQCTNHEGSYRCDCQQGFLRINGTCENINECVDRSHNCSEPEEKCVDTVGSFECDCSPGYEHEHGDVPRRRLQGVNQSKCVDIHECERGTHNCHSDATCTNMQGSFFCKCKKGYKDFEGTDISDYQPGTNCIDIDECDVPGICDAHRKEVCVNENGSHECVCAKGQIRGVNRVCTQPTCSFALTGGLRYPCNQATSDFNTENQGKQCVDGRCTTMECCMCKIGYDFVSGSCVRVRNCTAEQKQVCDAHASCQTTSSGQILCKCNVGYSNTGNARTGECMPQCKTSGANSTSYKCSANAEYMETKSENSCPRQGCTDQRCCNCNRGYDFHSNGTCVNIDECKADLDADSQKNLCASGTCIDTPGSYRCDCNKGFTNFHSQECVDVNECERSDLCPARHRCVNTPGAYNCTCADGYSAMNGTRTFCALTCETATAGGKPYNCINGAKYDNSKGKEVCPDDTCTDKTCCGCQNGYEFAKNGTCVDIDECKHATMKHGCHSKADCKNTVGGYSCQCEDGYYGDGKQHCLALCKSHTCTGISTKLPDKETYKCPEAGCNGLCCGCPDGYVMDMATGNCGDIDECAFANTCGSNAKCTNLEPHYKCECNDDYRDDGNGTCLLKTTCSKDAQNGTAYVCTNGGTLKPSRLAWTCPDKGCNDKTCCLCASGFEILEGATQCTDVDECSRDHNCDENAKCANYDGGYTCECNKDDGYTSRDGSGAKGACARSCDNAGKNVPYQCSGVNAQIQLLASGKVSTNRCDPITGCDDLTCCECDDGYIKRNGECELVDKCKPRNPCKNGTCKSKEGKTFTCTCNFGFELDDDGWCVDVDNCANDKNLCTKVGERCFNTVGSWKCICQPGYYDISDGKKNATCRPTCSTAAHGGKPYECENLLVRDIWKSDDVCPNGGCTDKTCCACQKGYEFTENGACVDINECVHETEKHDCHSNAKCVNTKGSFSCECNPGYEGHGRICSRKTDCDEHAVDYYGEDIQAFDVNTVDECHKKCLQMDACNYFTYTTMCYTKRAKTGRKAMQIGFISGPKICGKIPLRHGANCTTLDPCGPCQGNCEEDSQCIKGFKCTNPRKTKTKDLPSLLKRASQGCSIPSPDSLDDGGFCYEEKTTCATVDDGRPYKCEKNALGANWKFGTVCPDGGCTDETCCMCQKGYKFAENGACVDINECTDATEKHDCPENAECINTVGSFSCECQLGYQGGGRKCSRNTHCDEVGMQYDGEQLQQFSDVGNVEKCHEKCFGLPACYYFTFWAESSTCYTMKASLRKKVKKQQYLSGPKICGQIPLRNESSCTTEKKCSKCFGTCDDNSHCLPGLKCTKTLSLGTRWIPEVLGCSAPSGQDFQDFCFDPMTTCATARGGLPYACENNALDDRGKIGSVCPGGGCTDETCCRCQKGYKFSENGTCVDINECTDATEKHDCHAKAECINAKGSFSCECKLGYQGGGRKCSRKISCDDESIDYFGNDVGFFGDVKSMKECHEKCEGESTCNYITYVPNYLGCYLKSSNAGYKPGSPGFVSAPKICDPIPIKYGTECSSDSPCGMCQGSCVRDEECVGGFKCYNKGKSLPPGCSYDQSYSSDIGVCYDPKFGLRNAHHHCWVPCFHKTGTDCLFCGSGKCCRKGSEWKQNGCNGKEGHDDHHICVPHELQML